MTTPKPPLTSFEIVLANLEDDYLYSADSAKAKQICEAADDLLAALQRARRAMLGYTHRNAIIQSALDAADAAIAKATGEKS